MPAIQSTLAGLGLATMAQGIALPSTPAVDWDTKIAYGSEAPPFHDGPYFASDPDRQHLHISVFEAQGHAPGGVYLAAHGNNGTADGIGPIGRATITGAGYNLISWESITRLTSAEDFETCWSDIELVFQWTKDNAATYNFDASNIIVGGRSRGSGCSWKFGHSGRPEIKGIYMYNALPDGMWINTTHFWDPASNVTENSPPAFLAYGPECPKPITQNCTLLDNIHNPRHGQTIVDRYHELGLQHITLTDGMEDENGQVDNIYVHFPDFVASLTSAPTTATPTPAGPPPICFETLSALCPGNGSPVACKDCVITNQEALGAAGCTRSVVKDWCKQAASTKKTQPRRLSGVSHAQSWMERWRDALFSWLGA